ncbi:helix-turn-helix domain-containing protein [Flavivirga rizhaonensis]|uniref:Helix-turn-helix domain-containing protein n=1 Tax=Flavivirga rizhaonensis TaxID=2559571 RepID=A0A4S1DS64_9FLAO|nr:helix-turn-helix domain-containing protein [Flavivirga rizhaonensis]TGV00182.1 helix-turn-helix domain-containing protein [Flavivirga rizhaonensis]
MAKQIDIEIKESESELKSLLNNQSQLLQYQRAKALLLIKQGKVTYTYELAKKLKRERKTIYNWLKLYKQDGITGYLKVKSRGSRREEIPQDVKQALAEQLSNPSTTITSYVELLEWIECNFGILLNYKTLYSHCRTHHKSVLKVARKSHHRKDEQAVEAFKKTAPSVQ